MDGIQGTMRAWVRCLRRTRLRRHSCGRIWVDALASAAEVRATPATVLPDVKGCAFP